MNHLPLIVVEIVLVFGGVLVFAWWQLRDLARERKKREDAKRPGLRELPEHLPRRTVLHTPQGGCNCEACGRGLRESARNAKTQNET